MYIINKLTFEKNMIKKYAIKVPFPDEDDWVFVTRDPHLGDTLEYPGERPLKLYDTQEEAQKFANLCNGVIVKMVEHDGWWEQDHVDEN
jgi:hypothetical protein